MKLTREEVKKRIEELKAEIIRHNNLYYRENQPIITDFEYDILLNDLKSLEDKYPEFATEDSPTVKVGSDLHVAEPGSLYSIDNHSEKEFRQVAHKYPMLSLSNTYDKEELRSFDQRVKQIISTSAEYVCELKIDGSAISLVYSGNRLLRGITRGDGSVGDDITRNILKVGNIPTDINNSSDPDFEIRGEIFMPWGSFDALNKKREEDEEPLFANPRNAAAGSLKLLDSEEVANRGLKAILYHVITDTPRFSTHYETLKWARDCKFPVSEHTRLCSNIEEVFEFIDHWDIERKKLEYPTDGIVIKVNSLADQIKLGYTAKSPRWATAYKFKPEQATTKLLSIDYQVGRTGAITPVANLSPVLLSGTVVKRASLHNFEQIRLLDVRIGDYLFIEKGGEIIPKVTGVDMGKRSPDCALPEFPRYCPDCETELVKKEDEAKYYCPNYSECPTQIKARFVHFTGRKSMNILAGEATIDQLYEKGYITRLSDIYKLTKDQLLTLEGWKERSVDRFLKSIQKSLETPFHKVLFALGIRFVGETTAKNIANNFNNIDALIKVSQEELLSIEDIGGAIAESISEYFKNPQNLLDIEELRKAGVKLEAAIAHKAAVSDKLRGVTIVVSGNFSVPRDQLKGLIEEHSGKVGSSVSANTNFIVAGENMGPSKLNKANKLGIKIISESDFMELIK